MIKINYNFIRYLFVISSLLGFLFMLKNFYISEGSNIDIILMVFGLYSALVILEYRCNEQAKIISNLKNTLDSIKKSGKL